MLEAAALVLAFGTAWSLLLSGLGAGPLASVLGGGVLALASSRQAKPRQSKDLKVHPLLFVLGLLLALIGWLHLVGGTQLQPERNFLLLDLPKIAQLAAGGPATVHPLGAASEAHVHPATPLAAVGGADPWRAALILGGIAQLAALTLWFCWATRAQAKAPLAVTLGGLALFWGTSQGWLLAITPWVGLSHLLALGFIVLCSAHSPLWAAPCLLALLRLSPTLAAACALFGLALLLPRRAWLVTAAVAGSLAIHGASWGTLLAAYLYWRAAKAPVRALALAGLAHPGALEWAALGLAVGRYLTAVWHRTPSADLKFSFRPLNLVLPGRAILLLVSGFCLWRALIGGEEVFNDEILIRSQKEKASLLRLMIPYRLSDWVAWRGTTVGFDPRDHELVASLSRDGVVLYESGEHRENPEVPALLSSLARGRSMAGWHVDREDASPLPAVAAYFSSQDPDLLRATPVRRVVRRDQEELTVTPWPEDSALGQAASVTPVRMQQWGGLVWFQSDGPTAYQVEIDGKPFGADYPVRRREGKEIPYVPPRLPGEVRLLWSHGENVSPPHWPLLAHLKIPEEVPTRSLLTAELELENSSPLRLEIDQPRALRWRLERLLSTRPGEVSPLVPLAPLVLEPHSSQTLSVSFRTPAEMGTYQVHLEILDIHQVSQKVALGSELTLRTWRRHPLVAVPDGVVRVKP